MKVVLAPIKLKKGVSNEDFLEASNDFEENFVKHQDGIVKRVLLKGENGSFADLVFFKDMSAFETVMEAEQNSSVCMNFFGLMEMDDGDTYDIYDALAAYEPA